MSAQNDAGSARIGEHVLTWLLAVCASFLAMWAWLHTHPAPAFVAVDVTSLVQAEAKRLGASAKPGVSKEQQEDAIRQASQFGARLDAALAQLASECGCTVLNAAAIVAQPARHAVRDATERVRAILEKRAKGT